MKYTFFTPDGETRDRDVGSTDWLVEGTYAYWREKGVWFRRNKAEPPQSVWDTCSPEEVPAEHRGYILLNP